MTTLYQMPELIQVRLGGLSWTTRHLAEMPSLVDLTGTMPVLILIPYRLAVVDVEPEPALQETVVVAAVARSVQYREGQAARQQAAEMLTEVAGLLAGWAPTPSYTPLRLETPPSPRIEPGVVAYFLQFSSVYALTEP